jgi:hypothetical protein
MSSRATLKPNQGYATVVNSKVALCKIIDGSRRARTRSLNKICAFTFLPCCLLKCMSSVAQLLKYKQPLNHKLPLTTSAQDTHPVRYLICSCSRVQGRTWWVRPCMRSLPITNFQLTLLLHVAKLSLVQSRPEPYMVCMALCRNNE